MGFPDHIHCKMEYIDDELLFKMRRGKIISVDRCNLSYIQYEYNGKTIFPTTSKD